MIWTSSEERNKDLKRLPFKYFWFECSHEGLDKIVVEALDWERAFDLFCESYGVSRGVGIGWHQVDFPLLEASGTRFQLIMANGIGITIND